MKRPSLSRQTNFECEAEVTPGLEFVSEIELRELGAAVQAVHPGEIEFGFARDLRLLLRLKTVQSVSLVEHFAIPRPRALLGNVELPRLLRQIERVRTLWPQEVFQTFYIAAAGSDSSIMQRIKSSITNSTGLTTGDEKGDLAIRIRPSRVGGWETVVRLSPRPLVTRSWRVCNLEGALNAATAHAMIRLTQPQPDDIFLNLGCGSGTLLVERLTYGRCQCTLGFDNVIQHLVCARTNIVASGFQAIQLQLGDMARLPLRAAAVTALAADLPFGQLSGSHSENQRLYPPMLTEAARVAAPGARFALITHEVRMMDELLSHSHDWSIEQTIRVNLRGLHPRIYILRRL